MGKEEKRKKKAEFLEKKKGEVRAPPPGSYQQVTSKLEEHDFKPDELIIMSKDRLQHQQQNPIY